MRTWARVRGRIRGRLEARTVKYLNPRTCLLREHQPCEHLEMEVAPNSPAHLPQAARLLVASHLPLEAQQRRLVNCMVHDAWHGAWYVAVDSALLRACHGALHRTLHRTLHCTLHRAWHCAWHAAYNREIHSYTVDSGATCTRTCHMHMHMCMSDMSAC